VAKNPVEHICSLNLCRNFGPAACIRQMDVVSWYCWKRERKIKKRWRDGGAAVVARAPWHHAGRITVIKKTQNLKEEKLTNLCRNLGPAVVHPANGCGVMVLLEEREENNKKTQNLRWRDGGAAVVARAP